MRSSCCTCSTSSTSVYTITTKPYGFHIAFCHILCLYGCREVAAALHEEGHHSASPRWRQWCLSSLLSVHACCTISFVLWHHCSIPSRIVYRCGRTRLTARCSSKEHRKCSSYTTLSIICTCRSFCIMDWRQTTVFTKQIIEMKKQKHKRVPADV
jgi:hypothetical protein